MVYTDIQGLHKCFIFGALASIFGAASSAASQRETNKTNLKIARETNALQYRMFSEAQGYNSEEAEKNRNFQAGQLSAQQGFARSMWEDTNAYNDPSQQRARWERAGFSPWSLASQGNAGVAQSTSPGSVPSGSTASSPGVPSLHVAEMQSPLIAGLGAYFGLIDSINKTRDSKQNAKESDSRIDSNYSLKDLHDSQTSLNSQMFDYLTKANPVRLDLEKANADIANLQARLDADTLIYKVNEQAQKSAQADLMTSMMRLDLEKQEIVMKYFEVDQLLNINMKSQQLSNLIAQGELTRAQAATELAKSMDYYASANLKNKQAGLVEQQTKTEEANTRIANADADIAENNAWDSNVQQEIKEMNKGEIKALAYQLIDNAYLASINEDLSLTMQNDFLRRHPELIKNSQVNKMYADGVKSWIDVVEGAANAYGKFATGGKVPTQTRHYYGTHNTTVNNK